MNRVVIRLFSMVSYAGYVVEQKLQDGKVVQYRLKPSDKSGITISIPTDEISSIFCMSGEEITGEDLCSEHRF